MVTKAQRDALWEQCQRERREDESYDEWIENELLATRESRKRLVAIAREFRYLRRVQQIIGHELDTSGVWCIDHETGQEYSLVWRIHEMLQTWRSPSDQDELPF